MLVTTKIIQEAVSFSSRNTIDYTVDKKPHIRNFQQLTLRPNNYTLASIEAAGFVRFEWSKPVLVHGLSHGKKHMFHAYRSLCVSWTRIMNKYMPTDITHSSCVPQCGASSFRWIRCFCAVHCLEKQIQIFNGMEYIDELNYLGWLVGWLEYTCTHTHNDHLFTLNSFGIKCETECVI